MVTFTNKFGLPDEFYRYRKFKPYSKGDADISATSLIKPPMVRVLEEMYDDEIEIDVVDQMWAIYGTAVHEVLATGSGMQAISEEDIYLDVDGTRVKGGVDAQKVGRGGYVVEDYKTTTVYAYQRSVRELEDHHWTQQLNIYAHMIRATKGVDVIGVRVWAILRDWSKTRAKKEAGGNIYPRRPIEQLDLPLWSPAEAEAFLRERVRLHQEADAIVEAGGLPDVCSPEERWEAPKSYAVFGKIENVRPTKVFDERAVAEDELARIEETKGTTGRIEERGGEPVRCLSFCNVKDFCPFGSKLKDE